MDIRAVLLALLPTFLVNPITSQGTNNEVCNANSEADTMQCTLRNIQHTLETQALTMRDIRETQLFQSTRDCSDLYDRGQKASGVYSIYTGYFRRAENTSVYCDMVTDGGRWTVEERILILRGICILRTRVF